MNRVNAFRVMALMQDLQILWHLPAMPQIPGVAVSWDDLAVDFETRITTSFRYLFTLQCSLPDPATRLLVALGVLEESLGNGLPRL